MYFKVVLFVVLLLISACSSMESIDGDPNLLPPTASGTLDLLSIHYWSGVSGKPVRNLVKHVRFPGDPSTVADLVSIDFADSVDDQYGRRIVGLLSIETSGSYKFRVSADHSAEVWLSTDASPINKRLVAYTTRPTGYRVWDKYNSQISSDLDLEAGSTYFIEILHKEHKGEDYLNVSWEGPDFALSTLTNANLLAYQPDTPSAINEQQFYKTAYHVGYASGMNLAVYDPSYPIPDQDLDGVPDFYEHIAGTDQNDITDALGDADGDLLTNYEEYMLLSDSNSADTDGDSVPDGYEFAYGLAVLDPTDAAGDIDGDGVSNLLEYQSGSDPSDSASVPVDPGPVGPVGPVERLVTLSWEIPTQRQDGSYLTFADIKSYRIYSGVSSNDLNNAVDVLDPSQVSYSESLSEGTYYYGISTVTNDGAEGPMSSVVTLVVN